MPPGPQPSVAFARSQLCAYLEGQTSDAALISSYQDELEHIQRQFRSRFSDPEDRPDSVQNILNLRRWDIDIDAVRTIHYARQQLLSSVPDGWTRADFSPLNDLRLVDPSEAAFHQFEPGIAANQKYVSISDEGRQEIVIRITGSGPQDFDVLDAQNGGRDEGSYNFYGADESGLGHMRLDVYPWVRFGNTPYDASANTGDGTTQAQRLEMLCGAANRRLGLEAQNAAERQADGQTNASPLVLDLDGDGIELVALEDSAIAWDIDEDGFREHVGWVAADDGLLAIDLNGDGLINDHGELFGTQTVDGFTVLSAYDSNADGLISAEDARFGDLLVWQDADQDGVSTAGELRPLSALGITAITLDATTVSQQNAGHAVTHVSTFEQTVEGQTINRAIHDVWFTYDNLLSVYEPDYPFDLTTLYLPELRGYGDLADLRLAMMPGHLVADALRPLVADLESRSFDTLVRNPTQTLQDIRALLFVWAGVDGVDPASRGPYIDARELAFMEVFTGTPFLQRGWSPDPYYFAALDVQEGFDIMLDAYAARLLAQSGLHVLYDDTPFYQPASDDFTGGTTLNAARLAEVAALAAADPDPLAVWSGVVRMIEYGPGTARLTAQDRANLEAAISGTVNGVSLDGVLASLLWASAEGMSDYGSSGNDTIAGQVGDDTLSGSYGEDRINGSLGADRIDGGPDKDWLTGGLGADLITGGLGSDNYEYALGHGIDTYWERGTDLDKIRFGAGITADDVTLTRVSNTDLKILIQAAGTKSEIVIQDQFNYGAGGGHIELLRFRDGTRVELDTRSYTLTGTIADEVFVGVRSGAQSQDRIYGKGGNDVIYGYGPNQQDYDRNFLFGNAGNDTLYGGRGDDRLVGGVGDDVIHGGQGNDTVIGGQGNDSLTDDGGDDTYRFAHGDGSDSIAETRDGDDTLAFLGAITEADISFFRLLNAALVLEVEGGAGGRLTIETQFLNGGGIETFAFSDGSVMDLTQTAFETRGTSDADTIRGVRFGGSNVDRILGYGGDDTLFAYGANQSDFSDNALFGNAGNDHLYGGRGDDTLNGGVGDDTLDGASGNDLYIGGRGNDSLTDDGGDDTYRFDRGHGQDRIAERGGARDEIVFGAGITATDLTMARMLNNALQIDVADGAQGQIFIETQFVHNGGIETLRFADGSTLDLTQQTFQTLGSDGDDTLRGIRFGGSDEDRIYGGAGNDALYAAGSNTFSFGKNALFGEAGDDSLYGDRGNDTLSGGQGTDYISGGSGNDVYIGGAGNDHYYDTGGEDLYRFNAGHGHDRLTERGGSADIIVFGPGIAPGDLAFQRLLNDALLIDIGGPVSGSFRIDSQFVHNGGIERLRFVDGTEVDLTQQAFETYGTDGDDVIRGIRHGGSDVDVIFGLAGDDVLNAAGSNTWSYGENTLFGGTGDDTLYGDRGSDRLSGGADDDVLSGGLGVDTFVFEAGHDRITDFDGDVLLFEDALWQGQMLTAAQIMGFASLQGGGTLFTFDPANTLFVEGVTDQAAIEAALQWF